MKYGPIKSFDKIVPGDVILDFNGVPRTVLIIGPSNANGVRSVSCEGMPTVAVFDHSIAQTVTLDELDAILTLHTAGLNPTPIQE